MEAWLQQHQQPWRKISQKEKDVVPPILRVAATTAPRPGLGLDGAGRGGAAVGLDARGG